MPISDLTRRWASPCLLHLMLNIFVFMLFLFGGSDLHIGSVKVVENLDLGKRSSSLLNELLGRVAEFGLRHSTRNRTWGYSHRGFESHPFRHTPSSPANPDKY